MAASVIESVVSDIASLLPSTVEEQRLSLARRIVDAFRDTYLNPLLAKLRSRGVVELLARKNPYLYRASGIVRCDELVERAFLDYVSSSTETLFGNFLERVALLMSGGYKSATKGVDIERRSDTKAELYVIKSGPAAFNAGSRRDAERALDEAAKRLAPVGTQVEKFIAFAYGRKQTGYVRGIFILSSSEFWTRITGIEDFHIRLLDICGRLAPLYRADLDAAKERLMKEARGLYCNPNGEIDWQRVLRASFESTRTPDKTKRRSSRSKAKRKGA